MKNRPSVERKSLFWSRVLGLLIAFAIVAVLVAGGVKSLTGELSTAYEALAASQYELGKTQQLLDTARTKWAATETELANATTLVERTGRKLVATQQQLAAASQAGQALVRERDDLKRGLNDALYVIGEADRALKARNAALQVAKAELEQIKQQPKLSVVMTTERQFAMSQREFMAASQTMMYAEGDGGMFYYQGAEAIREFEQHLAYSERTQVVVTQTGPGDDVLRCLQDGCALVLAAQQSAMSMESYAYQSEYLSSEMWMVGGRR
ncbi:MAG: hypothetical protein F4X02_14080 [Chloroflexi bacterium]|nr:hypothetical protein [Chloroflexota bacterium]